MSTLSIRVPDNLKEKAVNMAKRNSMSFNAFVNHWLQIAVVREETKEWMNSRLSAKNRAELKSEFEAFLKKTKSGNEPTQKEIEDLLK